jgi:hypothetical protein
MSEMKRFKLTACIVVMLAVLGGCEEDINSTSSQIDSGRTKIYASEGFEVDRIDIIGLTRIVSDDYSQELKNISVCVDVLDIFDSRIKAPCKFRFELFDYLPRSSQNMGSRLIIWKDSDLTSAQANNLAWKDHLRAYKFELPLDFQPVAGKSYMLQATCMTIDGKRITNTFKLDN